MTESISFPKSAVTAQFHSVHQSIEFVVLEQVTNGVKAMITITPDDCMHIMMKVLDQRKQASIKLVIDPDLDATKEGCQG